MVNNSSELARRTSQTEPGLNPGDIKERYLNRGEVWRVVQRADARGRVSDKIKLVSHLVYGTHTTEHLPHSGKCKNGCVGGSV